MDGLKCFHIQLTCIPSFDFSTAQELNFNLGSSGSKATRLNQDDCDKMFGKTCDHCGLRDPSKPNNFYEDKEDDYAFLANWVDDGKLNTLFFHNLAYKSDAPTDNYDLMFHGWSFKLGRDANIRARKITADHTLLFKRLMTIAYTNNVFTNIDEVDNEWYDVSIEFRNNPINTLQGEKIVTDDVNVLSAMMGDELVTNDFDMDDSPRWDIVKPEVDSFLNNASNVGNWYSENSFEWRTAD